MHLCVCLQKAVSTIVFGRPVSCQPRVLPPAAPCSTGRSYLLLCSAQAAGWLQMPLSPVSCMAVHGVAGWHGIGGRMGHDAV